MPYDARSDFNGDGRSDALLRNFGNEGVTSWLGQADGRLASNFANSYQNADYQWHVAGVGDFNGDGMDDLLWTGPNFLVGTWLGQADGGFSSNFGNFLGQVSGDWVVRSVGDFNGDGRDDILWQEGIGTITDWLGQPNGGFASNFENATCEAGGWSVRAAGDFNGDGRDDLLWTNTSGLVTNWLGQANGGFVSNFANWSANYNGTWFVYGAGDFNGDGLDDVLWRNSDGLVTDWLAQPDGSLIGNFANCTNQVDSEWQVEGIGDYNGDQRDDILWKSVLGEVTDWLGQPSGGFASNFENFTAHIGGGWFIAWD